MSQRYVVEGPTRLSGSIRPAGNKNAALPVLAAALLADGKTTIRNVPRIRDVVALLALIESLGCSVHWSGANEVSIDTSNLESRPLDRDLCARIRASILLAGPLLARFHQVELPPPGGDVIGRRRVDTHFLAFEALGAEVTVGENYLLESNGLEGADLFLDEPSVTGSENAIMAATLAKGQTTISNVASEPHVQDLCKALITMGAQIEGIGTNRLTIRGVEALKPATVEIGPDHIEVGSFVGLAAVTHSDLRIEGVRRSDLRSIMLAFNRLGIEGRFEGDTLFVDADQERRIRTDMGGHVPKIEDGPWPAFPADLTSIATVVATQCDGMVMIFEKMFESRLFFVDKLIGLGARIVLCDPHRAVVSGPSKLHGGTVESPDIRAGMAILLATLAAEGQSEIFNIQQIDRGYERIDERLLALGASIKRVG